MAAILPAARGVRRLDSALVSDFSDLVDAFLDAAFALDPVFATTAGNHEHDAEWPDLSAAGREGRRAFTAKWAETFAAFPDDALTLDERVDREILLGELSAQAFGDERLREESWSAMWWVYQVGEGFFGLLAREFAPLPRRLEALASRAERLPTVLAAAKEVLVGVDGRAVDRLHVEKALQQWPGLISIVDEAIELGEAAPATGRDPVDAALLERLRSARTTAASALDAFERHLRDDLLPAAAGEGRLGPELFAEKMGHTMRDESMTPDRIRSAAESEFQAVRDEMIRIARQIAPRWLGDAPGAVPADDAACVRAVLDAVAVQHPRSEDLLEFCQVELGRIEAFCRERDLIGLSDEPLEIDWTPVFLRTAGGAMLSSPGPLDRGLKSMFHITPIDPDAPAERMESQLRESNDRMLRLLTIHEAVPGHYLQGVYANRCPSIIRSIFWSGVFAEGWAVYVTQVMMDVGYGADGPALLLTHWKFYLRTVTNALIDVAIHTGGMSEEEAVRLMVDGGFQEEAEARAKFDRARLSSTQLSTYFVGSLAFWDLEDAARRQAADVAGAGSAVVPTPRVVGGYGSTPGFDYRRHLEECLAHGSPPMPILRRLVLNEAPSGA
jgi:uncharacterized protein (DUF885 family)